MTILGQSAFLKALGWALLNSVWQFGVLWLVFMVLIRNRQNLSPAVKHGAALGLLVAGFTWFGVDISIRYLLYKDAVSAAAEGFGLDTPAFYQGFYVSIKQLVESNLAYLSLVYLAIVSALFTKFSRYFYYAHTIKTRKISSLPAEIGLYVQQLVQRLSIHRKVHVWVSELIDTPMVIGFLKPTILMPLASINQLSMKQLEAILLHELAHIKRNDYLINLYVATMEVLFFFNPFSRLLLHAIKQEREKCCDDCVLQFKYDPHQYASALLKLEQNRPSRYPISMAATGGSKKLLLHRIQRIMGIRPAEPQQPFKLMAYFLTMGMLSFIALVNPGDLIKTKLVSRVITVNEVITSSGLSQHPGDQLANVHLQTQPKLHSTPKKSSKPATGIVHKSFSAPAILADYANDKELAVLTSVEARATASSVVEVAMQTDERDFTTPEIERPNLPAPSEDVAPFVPYSSFSYHNTVDTGDRKVKLESYEDRVARESLIRAQNALNKLDWKKIGNSLKQGKTSALALRKEIEMSLQDLNWKEINQEVRDSLNQVHLKATTDALSHEYQMAKAYKSQQLKLQQLTTQLQQQQELYKKDAQIRLNNLEKEVKKSKVIVYF